MSIVTIKTALQKVDGVHRVAVLYDSKAAAVTSDTVKPILQPRRMQVVGAVSPHLFLDKAENTVYV